MLAYRIAEADEMLDEKYNAAKMSLSNCEEDQEFLREQITVCLYCFHFWSCMLTIIDTGGCDGSSVQLGCGAAAERKGRRERRG